MVGWAKTVSATSRAETFWCSSAPAAAMHSVTLCPIMCTPSRSPDSRWRMTLTNPSASPTAIALPRCPSGNMPTAIGVPAARACCCVTPTAPTSGNVYTAPGIGASNVCFAPRAFSTAATPCAEAA